MAIPHGDWFSARVLQAGSLRHDDSPSIGGRLNPALRRGYGQPILRSPALVRNTAKVAAPWTIGHAAVFGIVASSAAGPDVRHNRHPELPVAVRPPPK
jgi:hypothetical protein